MNYEIIKPLFAGKMVQSQIEGIEHIIKEFNKAGHTDKRWLSYILATVFHETGKKMQPVKEFGGEKYLRSKVYYPWYGRDLVQTTWEANYKKVKAATGIDVIKNPDLIGQMPLAATVAVLFMTKGWYTGKKLSDYFNAKSDPINARRIINGKDKAELIAGYYETFLKALT
jgi:predicted chitinase